MKPVLFVVGSATSYRLQRLLAEYCVHHGRQVAFLYDGKPDALFSEVQADARLLGAPAVSLDDRLREDQRPKLRWSLMPHPVRAFFFSLIALRVGGAFTRALGARIAAAQQVLEELCPNAVMVSEDGISGPAAVMAAARSLGLPVIDLPYGYGTQDDLEIVLAAKEASNELIRLGRGPLAWLLAWLAPTWIKKGRFAGALIFPLPYIVAREALGMTLRNAWIVHGGYADRLLVESEQMMDLYRSEGLPEKKLVLTGSPYCDSMHRALSDDLAATAAFRRPRAVQPGRLRILVSWPPSYHASRGGHSEYPTYEEMSRDILTWLSALPGCELTVSLHPAVQDEMRKFIGRLGVSISDEYVICLIPKHDIYISYFSSTIRWALACGKPVVNYDAYRLGLDVYASAPAFFNVSAADQFKRQVAFLTSSLEGFAKASSDQASVAKRWGMVDGQCMSRILAEIDSIERG